MNSKAIRWQSRRGMKELDLFLLPFFDAKFDLLDNYSKNAYLSLLDEADPDIYNWLMSYSQPENSSLQNIVKKIREFRLSE